MELKRLKSIRMSNSSRVSTRQGALVVFLAVGLSVFAIFSAVAINTAYIQCSRTELRTMVDAAAKAAGQRLNTGGSEAEARQKAIEIAAMNKIAGKSYTLNPEAVVFGRASRQQNGIYEFSQGGWPVNAVKVRAERSKANSNGAIPTFLGSVLGVPSFEIGESATTVKSDRDIALIVDRSGSMMWVVDQDEVYPTGCDITTPPSPTGSRWSALMNGYSAFNDALNATTAWEKVGLVSYASTATEDLDLSWFYGTINSALYDRSQYPINGATNLGHGMELGINQLMTSPEARSDAIKTMVVLTDGIPNTGRDPLELAYECADKNIVVHTISFGKTANAALMQQIADITSGSYRNALTGAALNQAFREIAADLPVRIIQ